MRLLFVILAHDRPDEVAALARALVDGASDARALVHFDGRTAEETVVAFEAAAGSDGRVEALRPRLVTRWGEWGLVAAPLAALRRAEAIAAATGWTPDRAILLSGACLPCRPVAQLERFLASHPRQEFMEIQDQSWIKAGLRKERHNYYYPFNFQTQPGLHRFATHAQRALGVTRRFPEGLTPRFGSQWWALSWETCALLLKYAREHPDHMRFFESVWIPDEMALQTLVHALVPARRVHGRGLTHFQFTDKGKPIVYHDDHVDYVLGLDAFFFRKASPHAARLREACLSLATAGPERFGPPVARDGRDDMDYELKVRAQSGYPVPGRPFHAVQTAPAMDGVMVRGRARYLVVVGPPGRTRPVLDRLGEAGLEALGEVFAPGVSDFGPGRAEWRGLRADEWRLRDQHPALWLMRVAERGAGRAALAWSPAHAPALLSAVLRDPRALVVAALPRTGDHDADLVAFADACAAASAPDRSPHRAPPAPRLGLPRADVVRAWLEEAGARQVWRHLALGPATGEMDAAAAAGTEATAPEPVAESAAQAAAFGPIGGGARALLVALPWAPDPRALEAQRRAALTLTLARLEAAGVPEAPAIAAALRRVWQDWHGAAAAPASASPAASTGEDAA